jgi:HSP20 family protein
MSVIRWNDRNPVATFNNMVENFFGRDLVNDFLNKDLLQSTVPAVNVKETAENYVVEVAAPGLKKEDFQIELHNNLLAISAQTKQENESRQEKYTRREFSYTSFQRTFTLPNHVEAEHIDAKYVDGLLHLTLPKREEAKEKPSRKIEIG